MKVKACNEGHVFGATFLKEDQDHCPVCGLPLFDYELPAHGEKATQVEPEAQTVSTPISLLIAAALVTPQGQCLVHKVLEKIDDKFFK